MSDDNGTAPATIEQLLAKAKARRATVRVCLDQELLARHAELEAELAAQAEADTRGTTITSSTQRLADELQAFEAEIDAASTPFVFEAVGEATWADLLGKAPPTAEQRQLKRSYDPAKFDLPAIAASCVSPAMTVDQAGELRKVLNRGQWAQVLAGCFDANEGGGAGPKSKIATAIRALSGASSTTAGPGGSLAPGSSAAN